MRNSGGTEMRTCRCCIERRLKQVHSHADSVRAHFRRLVRDLRERLRHLRCSVHAQRSGRSRLCDHCSDRVQELRAQI